MNNTIFLVSSLTLISSLFFAFFNKKSLFILISLFSLSFLFFNRQYGPDYPDYLLLFTEFEPTVKLFFQGEIEPLWLPISFIASNILIIPNLSFLTVGLVSFFIRIYTAKKLFKQNVLFAISISIYILNDFFSRDMGQLRSGLSTSILGLAIYFYLINQKKYFYFFIITSALIHYQSIFLYILILLFDSLKIDFFKIKLRSFIFVILILIFFRTYMLDLVIYLQNIDIFSIFFYKVFVYMTSDRYSVEGGFIDFKTPYFVYLSLIISGISLIFNRAYYSGRLSVLMNIQLLVSFIFYGLLNYPVLASRFAGVIAGLNYIIYPIALKLFFERFNSSYRPIFYFTSFILVVAGCVLSALRYNATYII